MADNFGLKIGVEGKKEFKKALSEINSTMKVLGLEMLMRVYYKISITFYPVTGDGFTDYANYKINLFAELYDDASNVDQHRYPNSGIGDYVVYTNAKIITEFIKDPGE